MARLDIKDIPDSIMEELDRQREALGIGSRSDYIKLLINMDIMNKITITVNKNSDIEKELETANKKLLQLQQHQAASMEDRGQLQEAIKKLRRAAASYQDDSIRLKKELQELRSKYEKKY